MIVMIARLAGELVDVQPDAVLVRVDSITYRVLAPACDLDRLHARIGEPVEFHTHHYLEAQGQGNILVPRLIGFASAADRAFFELFTSVKGIGPRKALRSMSMPPSVIATAIAGRDVALLKSLPEIGKRTAETIVAELSGKVDRFVDELAASPSSGTRASATGVDGETAPVSPRRAAARDALAALVQLGEPRPQATQWVDDALRENPALHDAESILAAVYQRRGM